MSEQTESLDQQTIRVLVVDDHGLFGRGLELLLRAASGGRIRVVASTTDPSEAEALVAQHRPQVAIVDLSMPTRSGEDVIAAIKLTSPDIRTLIVSGTDDLERIAAALRGGADGFVPKTSDPAELLGPILSVAAGWSVLPGQVLRELAGPALPAVALTERDLWLLRRVAAGAEVKQLANELHVSERTAKRAVATLIDHFGVGSRIEAAALAGRLGMLEDVAEPHKPPAA